MIITTTTTDGNMDITQTIINECTIPTLAQVLAAGNSADGFKIINAADPEDDQDLATKMFVIDNIVSTIGLQNVITQNNVLSGDNTINITSGSIEILSTEYNSGIFGVDENGSVYVGDLSGSHNGTFIKVDDDDETIKFGNVKGFVDNAAAIAAGLEVGVLYRKISGGLDIVTA